MIFKTYELRTDKDNWLGTVVLSDEGHYFSMTDWGNLNFHWNVKGIDKYEEFILRLNTDYFAEKMYIGINYIAREPDAEERCNRYANKILPALQKAILEEKIIKD